VSRLKRYLSATGTLQELYDFLISAEYDSALASTERDMLAGIRAVALDVSEGRRRKGELDRAIRSLFKSPATSHH
jgi:hypothetical protein